MLLYGALNLVKVPFKDQRMRKEEKSLRSSSRRGKTAGQVGRRQVWRSFVHYAKESNFILLSRESRENMLSRTVA